MGWVGPAITAAGALGGAAMGGKGASKAADAQSKAAANALSFEREKETAKRAQYDQAMQEYRQRYAQWEQQRNGLLARYGVHPGGSASLASFGQRPSPTMGQGPTFGPQGMGASNMGAQGPRRLSLADFSGQRQPGAM